MKVMSFAPKTYSFKYCCPIIFMSGIYQKKVKSVLQIPKDSFSYIAVVYILVVLVENVWARSVSSHINFRLFAMIIVVFGLFHLIERNIDDRTE